MNRTIKTVLLATLPLLAVADPVTTDEAARAVGTWIGLNAQLGCRLGASVSGARTCVPTNGVSFHVVKLAGGGFVVTSADTEIEPILAFSESDDLVESERNPLWTLLRRDLSQRVGRRRTLLAAASGSAATSSAKSAATAKWAKLLPVKATNAVARLTLAASSAATSLSDIRVAPLLETKWSQQQDAYYANEGSPCYNYYTPNNYPCGCVATAGAQIMRYHLYPSDVVKPGTYACSVSGEPRDLTMQGGVYSWYAMPTVPSVGTTAEQRQAIGKLTSDIGISCLMDYGPEVSSSGGYMLARRLTDRFGYASAVAACGDSLDIAQVRTALISNLDAKLPVMLGISGSESGHAVVADGYGYSMSTFYTHINMGWGGVDDAWYAPPAIGEGYSSVDQVVYNIIPKNYYGDVIYTASWMIGGVPTNGVVCSGRVMSPSGKPVRGASVLANRTYQAETDEKGIYFFILSPDEYTISCDGVSRTITVKANVGSVVNDDGTYQAEPKPVINNMVLDDLTVSDEPTFVYHTVTFALGTLGSRTGGGLLTQSVTDGSAATAPEITVADGWEFTEWSTDFTKVTSDLIVQAQYKASTGAGGGDTPASTVQPGEWTTDVEGVKAAVTNGHMAVVLAADFINCWWSQREQPVFADTNLLSWASENGVYLVFADTSPVMVPGMEPGEAYDWFLTLAANSPDPGRAPYTPCIAVAGLADPDKAFGVDVVRCDGTCSICGVYYDGKPASLVAGLAAYLKKLETMKATLASVSIYGPETLLSEEAATYACVGRFEDGSDYLVDAKWEVVSGSEFASISSNGEFTAMLPAGTVQSRTSVIKATCTVGEVTKTASFTVTVMPITTRVTFDANGGAGAAAAVTATYGAKMPTVTDLPERRGYAFLGYYDAAEGGAPYYTETLASARVWDKKDETAVLYAQWKAKYGSSPWWPDPITDFDWMYEGVTNVVTATNAVAITGVSQEEGVLLVPETLADRPVVALANRALADKELSVVIVPTNVVRVGTNSLACTLSLTRLDFEGLPPAGLAEAGIPTNALVRYNDAYSNAWQLALAGGVLTNVLSCGYHPLTDIDWVWTNIVEEVDLGEACMIVGVRTGGERGPVDVRVPQSIDGKLVLAIGKRAFASYPGLSSVVIPPSVRDISSDAFSPCPNLESIDVIGGGSVFASVGGILYDKGVETLYLCPQAAASVTVPSSVRRIAGAAFLDCRRIETLRIPASVTEIGVPVFTGCGALTNVTVDARSTGYCVRDGVLYDAARLTLVGCLPVCRTAVLPQTVRRIADWGFCGCTNLTDVTLSKGLHELGCAAFSNATALTSVEIPSGVREIPDGAFALCSRLISVELQGAVTNIGAEAFASCSALTHLTVPADVDCLGNRAFAGCPSLELTFEGAPPSCGANAVSSCKCGFYTSAHADWQRVVVDGKWNGLAMIDRCSLASFDSPEASAGAGSNFVLVVHGGNALEASRVKVEVSYVNAKASDLRLREATVSGADGVEQTGLAFPLTLRWRKGDMSPKTIAIPVATGKATDAPKYLVWNLVGPNGVEVDETPCCIGTIAEGPKWDKTNVCVLPFVKDASGGKVSGGASVRPDAKGNFKSVALKATPAKGYWFAGWYANDVWVSGTMVFKATPVAGSALMPYEARFVPAMPDLVATYSGFATVNLKGMTLVKGANTSTNVFGEFPMTVTLGTSGKLSGAVTVGGKKVSFATDGCCALPEASGSANTSDGTSAIFRFAVEEKAWFGQSNVETLELTIARQIADGEPVEYGRAWQTGAWGNDVSAPLGSLTNAVAYRATDKSDSDLLLPFVGTYALAFEIDDGVVPLSVSVDKSGKVKATGRYVDGTTLAMSGKLSYGSAIAMPAGETASASLFAMPKAVGAGSLHVDLRFALPAAVDANLSNSWCTVTRYAAASVTEATVDPAVSGPYDADCWYPDEINPETDVVRLASGADVVDICYALKNGVVTGLASPAATGETVKFDAKTGLLVVTRGRTCTIQGILGGSASNRCVAGRINADGTHQPVAVSFERLPTPVESFPWTDETFSLSLGQKFGEKMQPSVTSGGQPLALTVTGLPAGLKFDKATGRITGAPTKAGTSTVTVSYRYATQTITRTTSFVVAAKPEDLPSGSYAGSLVVRDAEDAVNVRTNYCPVAVTVDRNGALSGSVTVAGKKIPVKAVGYDACNGGDSLYENAMFDLSALDAGWGEVPLALSVTSSDLIGANEARGTGDPDVDIVAWRCESRFWIDDAIDPDTTCLEVTVDGGKSTSARFAWTTKTVEGEKVIAGVGKAIDGAKLTFKVEDKTGHFSGTCESNKFFGAMEKGTCAGVGTVFAKDGSALGPVLVRVAER